MGRGRVPTRDRDRGRGRDTHDGYVELLAKIMEMNLRDYMWPGGHNVHELGWYFLNSDMCKGLLECCGIDYDAMIEQADKDRGAYLGMVERGEFEESVKWWADRFTKATRPPYNANGTMNHPPDYVEPRCGCDYCKRIRLTQSTCKKQWEEDNRAERNRKRRKSQAVGC